MVSCMAQQFLSSLFSILLRMHHDLGQFSAERVIATLRFYSKMLLFPKLITNDPELPLEDTLKYALSGYVEHMTGESHDDSVAAVLAHALPSGSGYSASAHRMWLSRYYAELERRHLNIVDFTVAQSNLLTRLTADEKSRDHKQATVATNLKKLAREAPTGSFQFGVGGDTASTTTTFIGALAATTIRPSWSSIASLMVGYRGIPPNDSSGTTAYVSSQSKSPVNPV